MVVSDYLPLTFVESDGFRRLMAAPCLLLPLATLSGHWEALRRRESRTYWATFVCRVCSDNSDTWTSMSTESYPTSKWRFIIWRITGNYRLTCLWHGGGILPHASKRMWKNLNSKGKLRLASMKSPEIWTVQEICVRAGAILVVCPYTAFVH